MKDDYISHLGLFKTLTHRRQPHLPYFQGLGFFTFSRMDYIHGTTKKY